MERIEFDLLFRWFVGIGIDDPVWDHSSFSKNRDRLLEARSRPVPGAVLSQPRVKRLLSSEHFSVDGTLIQAWASMKSFKPKQPPGDDGAAAAGAMRWPISAVRSVRTRRITAQPIPTRGSTAKGRAWKQGCASSATG